MLGELAYPLFVLHGAVFIIPFPDLFRTGDILAYLVATLGVLVPLYAITALLIFAGQGKHGERWRAFIEIFCRYLPILGKARQALALSRLAAALAALLNAGVLVINAWELAAASSGSPPSAASSAPGGRYSKTNSEPPPNWPVSPKSSPNSSPTSITAAKSAASSTNPSNVSTTIIRTKASANSAPSPNGSPCSSISPSW